MAYTDKNIVITPNSGSSTDDPKIVFTSANNTIGPQSITLRTYPTSNGLLSFESSVGQLFSISNTLTGTLFSVNDISGIPSITVQDTGQVNLAQYNGNVIVGTATTNTSPATASALLVVNGMHYADQEIVANNGIIVRNDNRDFAGLQSKVVWRKYSTSGYVSLNSEEMTANIAAASLVSSGTFTAVQQNIATGFGSNYLMEVAGYFYANTAGVYSFGVNSDDNSDLFVDGKLVADWFTSGGHGASASGTPGGTQRTVYLQKGFHRIYGRLVQGAVGESLEWLFKNPGDTNFTVIPAGLLYHQATDSIIATANGISIIGNVITSNVSTSGTELTLGQYGDTYGPTLLKLQNRNNQNGPLFDASLSSVALLDFGFKTSNAQKTIRYETRPTYSIIPNQTTVNEFQFGAAGSPDLAIGNTSVYVRPSAGSTPSTNTTSGALIVAGGAGISGNVYAGQIYTTSCKVAIGQNAGVTSQNTQSVAIGNLAAYANQQSYSVAIGVNAGRCFQQTLSVAIGYSAGRCFQGSSTVAIGYCAGRFSQNNQSIAIGNNAAYANQQTYSVAIGYYAGRCFQGASTVAIGYSAGRCSQGASTVAIGQCAGRFSQNTYSVAIGYFAGYSSQNTYSVAIGGSAGQSLQGNQAVAIGYFAAYKCQGCKSLALGYAAGACYQGTQATAIGGCAGRFSQNSYGVAIGSQAAFCRQRTYAVAIGLNAGRVAQGTQSVSIGSCSSTACQGSYSVAIGSFSGKTSQNAYSVAIGFTAGRCLQRTGAVAIGTNAGQVAQGAYAVAIGSNAGQNCQVTKSIAINASCLQLFANNQGLYINPVRNCSANISQAVYYNTTTKELTYAAPSFAIDQTARNLANTTAGGLITANANSFYIQSGLNTANGNISALQGGLIAANANSFYIQSGLNSANANIISLQTKANTLLPNIGSVITINSASQLYVSNNQPGLSSAVGALTVMGGIGAQDNVWIDGNLSITNPIPLIQFTGSNSYVAYTGTNDLTSWDQTPVRYTFTGDNAPQGITFKPDGTVIYIVGTTAPQRVYQLRLNSAWDQSTAINTAAFSVATQDTSPQDIWFKPDGSEMYILGNTNKRVWQYHLNTPWDINTASFIVNSNTAVGQLQTQDSTVTGLTFKPDGTQMYVNGSSNNAVYQYTLSTPWSVNTATYTTNTQVAGITSTQFSALAASSTAHAFNTDGTRMFVAGINTRDIVEFNLSTAWNVATSSYRTRRNVYWEDGGITGMYYTDTANSLYTIGTSFRIIFQYATNGTAAETIANNIVLTGNTTANGSLFVTGNFKVDGPSFFTSTLTQAGAATFNNTLSVSGTLTATGALGLSGAATGGVNLGTSVTTGNFGVGTVLTTGTLLYGGVSQTGNTAFGRSTLTSNLEIANGIVISGNTKTVGIGNYGTTGSSTVINIGVGSLGNTTINFGGNTNPGNTTVNFGQNTNISVLGTLSLSSNIVQNGISSNKVIVRNQPKGTFANLDNISVSVNTGGYPLVSTITGSQQVFWSWEKLSGGITAGSFTGATLSTTQTSIGINSGIGSGGDTVLINLYEQSGNNFYKISCYQMIISTNASIIVERMA